MVIWTYVALSPRAVAVCGARVRRQSRGSDVCVLLERCCSVVKAAGVSADAIVFSGLLVEWERIVWKIELSLLIGSYSYHCNVGVSLSMPMKAGSRGSRSDPADGLSGGSIRVKVKPGPRQQISWMPLARNRHCTHQMMSSLWLPMDTQVNAHRFGINA